MTKRTKPVIKSVSTAPTSNCRCTICGRKITERQHILAMGGKTYCESCYQDSLFANAGTRHRPTLERCDG